MISRVENFGASVAKIDSLPRTHPYTASDRSLGIGLDNGLDNYHAC